MVEKQIACNYIDVILKVIRQQKTYNSGPSREKNYPILFVSTKVNNGNKWQGKERRRPSYSKYCSYAFVCVYMLCNFISRPIEFQYPFHLSKKPFVPSTLVVFVQLACITFAVDWFILYVALQFLVLVCVRPSLLFSTLDY